MNNDMNIKKNVSYSSRTADKFVVRLPDGMREKVKARGKVDSRSMNAVVIQALARYLDGPVVVTSSTAMDDLVNAVLERIHGQPAPVVV